MPIDYTDEQKIGKMTTERFFVMSNYLELKTPVRYSAEWFARLREATAAEKTPVKWQTRFFHITAAFIENDSMVREIAEAFDRILSNQDAPELTFDKVDVFEAKTGGDFIVNLTATQPTEEFSSLIGTLREEVFKAGADIDGEFILHVTLGRIKGAEIKLDQLKRITDGIHVPPFTMLLHEAEYRYFKGDSIRCWTLNTE
ncbi:MAG: 2'-5' RNA ligase family protein [Bacteroidales bacterium]|nr:2'-5' RNA ligase family protein [Bacteroidales bacterium]